MFCAMTLLILAQSVSAYNHNTNNYSNNYEVRYNGMAWSEDGLWIPVSSCPYKCAINNACGTEVQC